jgi:hypothetical protein
MGSYKFGFMVTELVENPYEKYIIYKTYQT